MLMRRSLYLARADSLGDSWEGARGPATRRADEEFAKFTKETHGVEVRGSPNEWLRIREATVVCCWHANEAESAAMWSIYASRGIALQSRFGLLRDAFPRHDRTKPGAQLVHLGLVSYIDYEQTAIPAGNTFWPFMHKRESFSHEREVRLVGQRLGHYLIKAFEANEAAGKRGSPFDAGPIDVFPGGGLLAPVDIERLVENVYVAPGQPEWFAETVREVLRRFGFQLLADRVRHSVLGIDPLF